MRLVDHPRIPMPITFALSFIKLTQIALAFIVFDKTNAESHLISDFLVIAVMLAPAAEATCTKTTFCDFGMEGGEDDCSLENEGDNKWGFGSSSPSEATGPSFDHTYGEETDDGTVPFFAYAAGSAGSGATYIAELDVQDVLCDDEEMWTGSISFWYHLYGSDVCMDGTELALHTSNDDGDSWTEDRWYVSGNQGDEWKTQTFPLLGEAISQLRFQATIGTCAAATVAIDDIRLGPVRASCTAHLGAVSVFLNRRICASIIS